MSSTTTDADLLQAELDAARARNAAVECQAVRDGGMFDPVLRRWVAWDGEGPEKPAD